MRTMEYPESLPSAGCRIEARIVPQEHFKYSTWGALSRADGALRWHSDERVRGRRFAEEDGVYGVVQRDVLGTCHARSSFARMHK